MLHCGQSIVECSNCNDVFLFENELKYHRNLGLGIKTEKFIAGSAECHMLKHIHTWFKVMNYSCDQCNKIYASKKALIGHFKTKN